MQELNSWVAMTGGYCPIVKGVPSKVNIKWKLNKDDTYIHSMGLPQPTSKAGVRRMELAKVISTLLLVCRDNIDIYNVLKMRGLLEPRDGMRGIGLDSLRNLAKIARHISGVKYIPKRPRIIKLIKAGWSNEDIAKEMFSSAEYIKGVRSAIKRINFS